VADAAFRWAQDVLEPSRGTKGGIVGALLALVDGTLGGGWLGMALAERRAAKRIVRAHQSRE
jgi:hypothetical protein